MTKLEALKALAEKVEAGEWDRRVTTSKAAGLNGSDIVNAVRSYNGSLDAAKALHDDLLPGWEWSMESEDQCCAVYKDPMNCTGCAQLGHSSNPARAWLMAIIKALIAEEEAAPH